MGAPGVRLIVSDFVVSFMWVWSGVLTKMFVYKVLGMGGHELKGEMVKGALSIISMFLFALLGKITKGGSYNPLTILASAISGDFTHFLFTVGARIPAQVSSFSDLLCRLLVPFFFFGLVDMSTYRIGFIQLRCELGFAFCSFSFILK
uniref:Aquaporin sip2.1 n=1 Tax=Rhizophora mucronata TaxID=61149 RepID=A0A2P2IUR1_RHIMU